MKGFSKKTKASLLLFAAIMPVLIICSLFVKQTLIRHKMEEQLEKAALQKVTVHIADFKWLKEGKEAEINGRLFDVKEYSIAGGIITLKGLYDDDECEIKKTITSLYKTRHNGENSPVNTLLIKFFNNTIIDRNFSYTSLTKYKYSNIKENAFSIYSESLLQRFIPVATPPPNI